MTRIYWFSGTGNSYHVAQTLARAEQSAVCEAITHTSSPTLHDGDVLILVFPVYAFGPPRCVTRFIATLPPVKPTYVCCVATYASAAGAAGPLIRRALRKQGMHLDASFGVAMPTNYPPFGGAQPPEKAQRVNDKADNVINEICTKIGARTRGRYLRSSIFLRALGSVAVPMFQAGFAREDRKFRVDDNCTHCGTCAAVCPVNNIEMRGGYPEWQHRCEQCFACFHWCPASAIQRGKSEKQVRYHHPSCTVQALSGDISTPSLQA